MKKSNRKQVWEAVKSIMLVYADPIMLQTLNCLLNMNGYQVVNSFQTGRSALRFLKSGPQVDLVLLGCYLQDMDSAPKGRVRVPGWDDDRRQLKYYRHLRNRIAHENDACEEELCSPADAAWLEDFCRRILERTDPLAMYFSSGVQNGVPAVQEHVPAAPLPGGLAGGPGGHLLRRTGGLSHLPPRPPAGEAGSAPPGHRLKQPSPSALPAFGGKGISVLRLAGAGRKKVDWEGQNWSILRENCAFWPS